MKASNEIDNYGPKPKGWDELTKLQKEHVLACSRYERRPIWAVMDLGVPSDEECQKMAHEEERSFNITVGIIIGFIVIMVGAVTYAEYKPNCWWPSTCVTIEGKK